jgi:hypothetical protein
MPSLPVSTLYYRWMDACACALPLVSYETVRCMLYFARTQAVIAHCFELDSPAFSRLFSHKQVFQSFTSTFTRLLSSFDVGSPQVQALISSPRQRCDTQQPISASNLQQHVATQSRTLATSWNSAQATQPCASAWRSDASQYPSKKCWCGARCVAVYLFIYLANSHRYRPDCIVSSPSLPHLSIQLTISFPPVPPP